MYIMLLCTIYVIYIKLISIIYCRYISEKLNYPCYVHDPLTR